MNFLNLIENKLNLEKDNKYVAIIGSNASKTARSPQLWNYVYKKINYNVNMYPFDVKEKNLKKLFYFLQKDKNFLGCSVAVPFKEKAFDLLNKNIHISSINIGAINCIYRDKNSNLKGVNTDGIASRDVFEKKYGKIKSKKIAIMGFGGVGKAVATNFQINNEVFVFSRNIKDRNKCKKVKLNWYNYSQLKNFIFDMDIVINCTSIGFGQMKNKSPINLNVLKKLKKNIIIYDVIYNPQKTKLIKNSQRLGFKTLNGSLMNIFQAVLGFVYVNKNLKKKDLNKIESLMISAAK